MIRFGNGVASIYPEAAEMSQRRGDEWRVWWSRWCLLMLCLPLFLFLEDPSFTLSLLGLLGLCLHNGLRTWLLLSHALSSARFRTYVLVVFGLDVLVFFVALFPFIRQGTYPVQLLLALVLLEAIPRLRVESFPMMCAGVGILTVALIAYELLALRFHENGGRILLWSLFFLLAGLGAVHTTWQRRSRSAAPPAPETAAQELPPSPPRRALTPQQHTVLRLLPSTLKRREIAEQLHLSEETVNSHIQRVYRYLDVTSRDAAVTRARTLGLLNENGEDTANSETTTA